MRNVEIKARVSDINEICKIAQKLSESTPQLIKQDDTFYNVKEGRLKLRTYEDLSGTLVRYSRDDQSGPKLADYELLNFSVNEIEKMKLLDEMLKKCLGVYGRVVKERQLYMVGQTRIHIDTVKDLGHFMELEVVLQPEQSLEDGTVIAKEIQTQLGVKDEDLISYAYVDLINEKLRNT